jgi:hypothetical protein
VVQGQESDHWRLLPIDTIAKRHISFDNPLSFPEASSPVNTVHLLEEWCTKLPIDSITRWGLYNIVIVAQTAAKKTLLTVANGHARQKEDMPTLAYIHSEGCSWTYRPLRTTQSAPVISTH